MDIPGWVINLRRPPEDEPCLECAGEIGPKARRSAYGSEYCSQECLLNSAEERGWAAHSTLI